MFYFEFSVKTCNRFNKFNNNIMWLGQIEFCLEFNETVVDDTSSDIDQQNLSLSLWWNRGHPQIKPFDIGANSSPSTSSSSSDLFNIVYMSQTNNVFGSYSFFLNEGDLQINLAEGIEVFGSC